MDEKLSDLGLSTCFTQQLSVDEIEHCQLARVFQVQRSRYILGNGSATWPVVPGGNWFQLPAEQRATVGDWVVLDSDREKITRVLARKSVFKRLAAGTKIDVQLMAANIDTLFVVSSCNEDFRERAIVDIQRHYDCFGRFIRRGEVNIGQFTGRADACQYG